MATQQIKKTVAHVKLDYNKVKPFGDKIQCNAIKETLLGFQPNLDNAQITINQHIIEKFMKSIVGNHLAQTITRYLFVVECDDTEILIRIVDDILNYIKTHQENKEGMEVVKNLIQLLGKLIVCDVFLYKNESDKKNLINGIITSSAKNQKGSNFDKLDQLEIIYDLYKIYLLNQQNIFDENELQTESKRLNNHNRPIFWYYLMKLFGNLGKENPREPF